MSKISDWIYDNFVGIMGVTILVLVFALMFLSASQREKECTNLMRLATSWSDSTLIYAARKDCLWK